LFSHSAELLAQSARLGGWTFPLAVALSAFVGSLHCVAMCGGLVSALAPTRSRLASYQLGRLAAYGSLGAGAGAFGRFAISPADFGVASHIAAALLAVALVTTGIRLLRRRTLHFGMPAAFSALYSRVLASARVSRREGARTWAISGAGGALSALLPCGWLYAFVLAAAASGSAQRGAVFMAAFWLGTLPSLLATPFLVRNLLRPLSSRAPAACGILLVVAGLATIVTRLGAMSIAAEQSQPSCHSHDHEPKGTP
jgi:uncharacterized protein